MHARSWLSALVCSGAVVFFSSLCGVVSVWEVFCRCLDLHTYCALECESPLCTLPLVSSALFDCAVCRNLQYRLQRAYLLVLLCILAMQWIQPSLPSHLCSSASATQVCNVADFRCPHSWPTCLFRVQFLALQLSAFACP